MRSETLFHLSHCRCHRAVIVVQPFLDTDLSYIIAIRHLPVTEAAGNSFQSLYTAVSF